LKALELYLVLLDEQLLLIDDHLLFLMLLLLQMHALEAIDLLLRPVADEWGRFRFCSSPSLALERRALLPVRVLDVTKDVLR